MPLLAAAVGVWALACGDLRVAPLAVAFWSFAAQQHLSVLPAAAVLGGAGCRRRRVLDLAGRGGGAAAVARLGGRRPRGRPGPVVAGALPAAHRRPRQPHRAEPLLGRQRPPGPGAPLGARPGRQRPRPRPFLGRSSPKGWDLVAHRSTAGVLLTFLVVGLLLAVGGVVAPPGAEAARGHRHDRRARSSPPSSPAPTSPTRRSRAGSTSSTGPSRSRSSSCSCSPGCWCAWLEAKLPQPAQARFASARTATACALAAIVILGVAVTPLVVDRPSDRLGQPLAAPVIRDLVDEPEGVRRAGGGRRAAAGARQRRRPLHPGRRHASAPASPIDGGPIVFPPGSEGFVHPDRIADPCTVQHALVISLVRGGLAPPAGRGAGLRRRRPGLDREALARLEAQAKGQRVDPRRGHGGRAGRPPGRPGRRWWAPPSASGWASRTQEVLLVRAQPRPADRSPGRRAGAGPRRPHRPPGLAAPRRPRWSRPSATAHLLDRQQLEQFRPDLVAGC